MSINLKKLKPKDVGRWVEYEGYGFEVEKGRIKSWNDKWIFVVYKCDKNWDRFGDYTAVATSPKTLTFCNRQRV